MEIEFSPSQLPAPRASSPVNGAATRAPEVSQTPSLQGMAELQNKLNQLALTRPDKMAAAQPLISDLQYPPEELLNGIAHLLAMHLKS
jgi:hypothetical protein